MTPMSKRPAFQFYPGDWRNDPGLRLCSMAARGLWMDMLCLMHEGEPYGHLTVLGRAMTPEALAKLVGESAAAVKRWLNELQSNDVCSLTDDGLIYSRRMVRDEQLREVRAAGGHAGAEHGTKGASHGSKGGRPRKPNGASSTTETGDKKPPLEPPPSSSSPSSSPEGSEANASGAERAVPEDLDAEAWAFGTMVLRDQGGLSDPDARKFFGKLLGVNGLIAREMLPSVAAAMVNRTQDPKGYLTKAAQAIAKRRTNQPPKRVGFV